MQFCMSPVNIVGKRPAVDVAVTATLPLSGWESTQFIQAEASSATSSFVLFPRGGGGGGPLQAHCYVLQCHGLMGLS